MFGLDKHDCSIGNVNQRIERHGDERALAADIKFSTTAGNVILDSLEKGLKEALFRKPNRGEQQDIPGIGQALTAVKFPNLEPQRLSHEFSGYELTIDGMLEASEPIFLADVKLKKFVIEPLEGGSVGLTFTASANVEPSDLAELSEALIREDVRVTLTPPAKQSGESEQQEAA